MAVVALSSIGFAVYWAYTYPQNQQTKQAEVMRTWSSETTTSLGMKLQAKTKLTGGVMLMVLEFEGHPDYLDHPINQDRGFLVEWLDADGFTRVKKFLELSEFTTILDHKSDPSGLTGQFEASASVTDYSELAGMKVGWNIETEIPDAKGPQTASSIVSNDHCAPGISRQERLRRLAQHGQIRETGYGEFTAGTHSVNMMPTDGTLISCR